MGVSSCSLFQSATPKPNLKDTNPYLGVDFEENKNIKLHKDSLKINTQGSEASDRKRTPVVSFHFNPGKDDIFTLIGVLKVLEQKGIKPRLLSGHGWGFLFAALLAKFEKINSLDLVMLKLSYKLKKKSIHINSDKGLKELKKFVLKIFKESRIEHLPLTVVLPVWNESTNSFKLIRRGKVIDLFEKALLTDFQSVFLAKKSLYPDKMLQRAGSDIPLSFNVAHGKSPYIVAEQARWNYILRLQREKFNSSERVLDVSRGIYNKTDTLSDYIKRGEEYGHAIQPKITELLENWSNSG